MGAFSAQETTATIDSVHLNKLQNTGIAGVFFALTNG